MPKRILQGTVVSDKGDKTIVVRVERAYLHPKNITRMMKRMRTKWVTMFASSNVRLKVNSSGGKLLPVRQTDYRA